MFMERNAGTSTIDYPVGGSRAIVDALVRGIRKHGGRVLLRAPVQQVLLEGARPRPPPGLSSSRPSCGLQEQAHCDLTKLRCAPSGHGHGVGIRSNLL